MSPSDRSASTHDYPLHDSELYGDCAELLDKLETQRGQTVRELADVLRWPEDRIERGLHQLQRDGCAQRASVFATWWATR